MRTEIHVHVVLLRIALQSAFSKIFNKTREASAKVPKSINGTRSWNGLWRSRVREENVFAGDPLGHEVNMLEISFVGALGCATATYGVVSSGYLPLLRIACCLSAACVVYLSASRDVASRFRPS